MADCTCKAVAVDGKVWHSTSCPAHSEYARIIREHSRLTRHGVKAVAMRTRDAGFEHEDNDCFVKAIQAVTGVPYRDAHAFVAREFKRQDRKATHDVPAIMLAIETAKDCIFGFRAFHVNAVTGQRMRRVRFGYTTVNSYATVAQFARTHRTGKWLLWSNAHAFALIDGIVFDNGAAGAKTQVTGAFEFIASSQVEGGI